jgi:transcriptional regulator with XRE-family HTH domain
MKKITKYGAKIKELRLDKGWTQEHLASVSGLEPRTIQRVEGDKTKSPDTLAAIAQAFDLSVKDLGQFYQRLESQPPRGLMLASPDDFRTAFQISRHSFCVQIMAQAPEDVASEFRSIFTDVEYIEPSDRELVESFLLGIKEPLQCVREAGYEVLSLHQRRDIRFSALGQSPQTIEGWTQCHFILVPKLGCFKTGASDGHSVVHRFKDCCASGLDTLLKILEKGSEAAVFPTPAHVVVAEVQSQVNARLCTDCFPVQPDGSQLTWNDLAESIGKSVDELQNLASSIELLPKPNQYVH